MVNAWELLLKARILQRNKNKLESIYIVDPNKTRKDGTHHKKLKFKTSRSNNYLTIDVTDFQKLSTCTKLVCIILVQYQQDDIFVINESVKNKTQYA